KEGEENRFKEGGLARFVFALNENAPGIGEKELNFVQLFEIMRVKTFETNHGVDILAQVERNYLKNISQRRERRGHGEKRFFDSASQKRCCSAQNDSGSYVVSRR